jgi:hypothetical protein
VVKIAEKYEIVVKTCNDTVTHIRELSEAYLKVATATEVLNRIALAHKKQVRESLDLVSNIGESIEEFEKVLNYSLEQIREFQKEREKKGILSNIPVECKCKEPKLKE